MTDGIDRRLTEYFRAEVERRGQPIPRMPEPSGARIAWAVLGRCSFAAAAVLAIWTAASLRPASPLDTLVDPAAVENAVDDALRHGRRLMQTYLSQ